MTANTIGILHPGDMGHAVGALLKANGRRVTCALAGRSARTRAFAQSAALEDLGTVERLVAEADVVLSILVPAAALEQAQEAAAAIRASGRSVVYADCNAISLETTRRIAEAIRDAGGRYVDAGIIGPPPRKPGVTRFYASGPHAQALAPLGDAGMEVRVLGAEIGQASLFKTCYASVTKGLSALVATQLAAARRAGLHEPLRAELEQSQPALWGWMNRVTPGMPPKAHRWIAEMEEHARTFRELGLPGGMMEGSAELYRFVAASAAAREDPSGARPSLDAIAAALAEALGE
jgi:3-hydroxyisobutyrate dehydrogenase-like beta-hydroxyacid dehydrogenase